MIGCGLSVSEAWSLTVPDFQALMDAHRKIHAPADDPENPPKLTRADADYHREIMRKAEEAEGETKWQPV